MSILKSSRKSRGQSLAEYGLILVAASVVCIGALQALATAESGQITQIAAAINIPSITSITSTAQGNCTNCNGNAQFGH